MKACEYCGATITRRARDSDRQWARKRFCSVICQSRGHWITLAQFERRLSASPDGCLLWTGPVDRYGYGKQTIYGYSTTAPKAAWILQNGPIPEGLLVCHRCDNRLCCRLSHLYLGTVADNARDRARAGSQTGSRNGFAKLNEDQVRQIKMRLSAGEPVRTIAPDYGVGKGAIYQIRAGANWKQVAA